MAFTTCSVCVTSMKFVCGLVYRHDFAVLIKSVLNYTQRECCSIPIQIHIHDNCYFKQRTAQIRAIRDS